MLYVIKNLNAESKEITLKSGKKVEIGTSDILVISGDEATFAYYQPLIKLGFNVTTKSEAMVINTTIVKNEQEDKKETKKVEVNNSAEIVADKPSVKRVRKSKEE